MFARDRANACLADPTLPLPIFLKIDTWNRKTPLEEWLRSQMPGLPLQNIPLLYLCDGLDELGAERPVDPGKPAGERFDPRADFLRLAEQQMQGSQFVISCRSAEYQQIRSKMHGCGAVTLMPLDETKIEEFLLSWDRPRLWEALRNDPTLMELARTPLLSLLCAAVGTEEIDTEQTLQNLNESALFAFYYERRFIHEERKFQAQEPGQPLPFDRAATRQLLGRLALYMWHWRHDPLTALDRIEARFHLGAQADAFLAFACRMHFLRESPSGHISFIHLKFRDFCVVPALQQALDDRSVRVQQSAVEVLVQLKEIGLPTLLQALDHSNGAVRKAVTSELNRLPDTSEPTLIEGIKQVMPSLLQALYSTKADIRWSAAALIARLGSDAMPTLLPALQATDAEIRYTAASTLAHLDQYTDSAFPEALSLAVPILLERFNSFWGRSASELAHLADQTDMRPYIKYDRSVPSSHPIIESGNPGDSGETGSIGVQKDPQIVRRIREILRPSVPILVEALKYRDNPLLYDVRTALSNLREYLIPDLFSALRKTDLDVRNAALAILKGSERQAEPAVQEALARFVFEALRDLQCGETARRREAIWDILHLVPLIEQPDADLREKLKQIVPALFEALQDRQEETRTEVAAVLLELDVSVVPDLLKAFENSDVNVQRHADLMNSQPVPGEEVDCVFDEKRDHYLLLKYGWPRGKHTHYTKLHVRIAENKIWIEEDMTEDGLGNELVEAGIPKEDIVLAFNPPELRYLTEYALA